MSRLGGLFQRESRHIVGLFDSLARGQTGQAISSIGAAARDAGMGVAGLATSMGGIIAVMASVGILRHAQEMGKWAEAAQAAATASGMTINQLTRFQGSLELMGLKGNSADAQIRHLAQSLSTALADPTSKAAEAFRNMGISQEELIATGGNTAKVLELIAEHFNQVSDDANKSANMTALAGRGWETLNPLLDKGKDGLKEYGDEADKTGRTLNDTTAKAVKEAAKQLIIWRALSSAVNQALHHLGTDDQRSRPRP